MNKQKLKTGFSNNMKVLRNQCEFPTEKDLNWVETAVQRHTGGFEAFWKDNKDKLSGRDWMHLFISVWEGGRGGKILNK